MIMVLKHDLLFICLVCEKFTHLKGGKKKKRKKKSTANNTKPYKCPKYSAHLYHSLIYWPPFAMTVYKTSSVLPTCLNDDFWL